MEQLDNTKNTSKELPLKVVLPVVLLFGLVVGLIPVILKSAGLLIGNAINYFSNASVLLIIPIWVMAAGLGYFIGEKLDRNAGRAVKTSITIGIVIVSVAMGLILISGKWKAFVSGIFLVSTPFPTFAETPTHYPRHRPYEPVYPVLPTPLEVPVRPSVERLEGCRQSCGIYAYDTYGDYIHQYSSGYARCVQQCFEDETW